MKRIKVFILFMLLTLCIEAQEKTGYFIAYRSDVKGIVEVKTTSLTEVYAIVEILYPKNCFDLEKIVKENPYFFIDTYRKGIYIELKRINKKGKYKRIKFKE